jgi:predicted metal-dependent phosphoesterase TrpH
MTEIRERIAQRAVDKYNKKLSEGYFKNYEKAQDRKLNPITFGTVTTTNWEPN